jgi:Flp pilus assembly protein TadG
VHEDFVMRLSSFLKNTNGNIAVVFSLALVPLLLAAGAGTDILRQNDTQTLLQAAADAAAMAGSSQRTEGDVKTTKTVKDFLTQNEAYAAILTGATIKSGLDKATGNFYVRINGKVNTTFMALAGIPTLEVGAYSEVNLGGQDLEVALVLDNTASMNSEGRLDSLKSASKSLVDTLFKAKPANGYLKVGIVPFADYVNVGMSNRNVSWMNVPPDTTTVVKNVCSVTYPNAVSSNCHNEMGTWNNDGVPTPYTYQVCDWNYGKAVTVCSDQTIQNKWYGCVGSRISPLDTGIGSISTKYPGIQNTSCPQEITPLSDQKATLISAIDAMTAVGETYIPQGLLWGWNVIDSNEPITGAKTTAQMVAAKGIKSIVLMTDGDNTKSPDYPYHWGGDTVLADKITSQLCKNIKAAGISVYTVAFKVTKQSSKDLLAGCASNSEQTFDASDSAGLLVAFDQIAASLAQMRFTK